MWNKTEFKWWKLILIIDLTPPQKIVEFDQKFICGSLLQIFCCLKKCKTNWQTLHKVLHSYICMYACKVHISKWKFAPKKISLLWLWINFNLIIINNGILWATFKLFWNNENDSLELLLIIKIAILTKWMME